MRPTSTRRLRMLFAAVCLGSVLAWTACTASPPEQTGTASPAPSATAEARAVTIAPGRTIWLECQGTGTPTVILESGIHDSSDAWITLALAPSGVGPDVFTALAAVTRVCRYDRPGTILVAEEPSLTQRTSAVPMPRTIADAADDLQALIETAGLEPPFLMVGHSFGGFLQTYFAQTRPDEVAGLVLVDSFSAAIPELFGEGWGAYERVLNGGPESLASDPAFERWDITESVRLALDAPALRADLPVVVVSKKEPFALPPGVEGFTSDELEQVWQSAQADLAQRVPGTPQILAGGSDHIIQAREPDLVAQAVLLMMTRIARED
jgi:pimeloyl-ACP methyl ester carboxylesterase